MRRKHWLRASASAIAVLILFSASHACNVPVFRFALENWRADPYRVVLFHDGPLSKADQKLIRPLEEQHDRLLANLTFRTVDVNELEDADRELFPGQQDVKLPWLVVQYPERTNIAAPVWAGPLDGGFVPVLTNSPVRKELIRRLAEGQTAVWLLLESGDAQDDEAAALLEQEFKKLELTLALPELSSSPEDQLLASVPLRVAFSVLRVSRDDPPEQALAAMLIHSEPDLAERSDPLAFPVFGRGRALLPLIGAGITAENIHDSAGFLVGPCSCQVKELNPGFDLLLADEWDTLISYEGAPPADAANIPAADAQPELVPIPKGASSAAPAPAPATPPGTVTVPAPVVVKRSLITPQAAFSKMLIVTGIAIFGIVFLVGLVAFALSGATRPPREK